LVPPSEPRPLHVSLPRARFAGLICQFISVFLSQWIPTGQEILPDSSARSGSTDNQYQPSPGTSGSVTLDTARCSPVLLAMTELVRPLGIIHRRGKLFTPTIARFLELLRQSDEKPTEP